MQRRLDWCYDFLFSNTDYQFSQAVFKHRKKEIHDSFKGSFYERKICCSGTYKRTSVLRGANNFGAI